MPDAEEVHMPKTRFLLSALLAAAIPITGCGESPPEGPRGPGQDEWTPVAKDSVAAECGLDLSK